MTRTILTFLFSVLISKGYSQKFLCLDTYRLWDVKRTSIYAGETLTFKLKGSDKKETWTITGLQDSVICFSNDSIIKLREIKIIYINRSNYVTRKLSSFLINYGIAFSMLDAFNNAIHPEFPGAVIQIRAVIIGASCITAGLIIKLYQTKRWRPGENKTLKIIDLSPV